MECAQATAARSGLVTVSRSGLAMVSRSGLVTASELEGRRPGIH